MDTWDVWEWENKSMIKYDPMIKHIEQLNIQKREFTSDIGIFYFGQIVAFPFHHMKTLNLISWNVWLTHTNRHYSWGDGRKKRV